MSANSIINGDCLNILPQLPPRSVNFVLTDPPYITKYKSRDGRTIHNDDNDAWLEPAFAEIYRVLERDSFCVTFYGWPQADRFITAYRKAGFRLAGHLTFPKRYTSSTRFLHYQHECAHLLIEGNPGKPGKTISDVRDWSDSGTKLHPTQKPLNALLPLIETFSASNGMVLDPFAGSGSTLLAAKMLGRSYLRVAVRIASKNPLMWSPASSRHQHLVLQH
jgi:adenine-specific DNA-methyltransferase